MGSLPQHYIDLLRAHYRAPAQTVTAASLAQAVGYKHHSAANLHYGKLAGILSSELARGDDEFVRLKLLVELVMPGGRGNKEILWVMRPEVAQALESLGWT